MQTTSPSTPRRRRWRLPLLILYLAALVLSHTAQWAVSRRTEPGAPFMVASGMFSAAIPAMTETGPAPDQSLRLRYLWFPRPDGFDATTAEEWHAPLRAGRTVLLLHGSPGRGDDFQRLGAALAAKGYQVLAPDLPGFGESIGRSASEVPSLSSRAHARSMLALLDSLGIQHVHVVGWSNGGGTALHMADLAPDRLQSLTLLASIGTQRDEGSGSYWFEHAKYRLGIAAVGIIPECLPHFGVLGTWRSRIGWLRNFADSDQRMLKPIMQRLTTPTLILHGRQDPLAPAFTAEHSQALIPSSRLVMTPWSHFMPFAQPEQTADILAEHFGRHTAPGVPPRTDTDDRAPVPTPISIWQRAIAWAEHLRQGTPWWAPLLAITALTTQTRRGGAIVAALLVSCISLDLALAVTGVASGALLVLGWQAVRRRHPAATGVEGGLYWPGAIRRHPFAAAFGSRFIARQRAALVPAAHAAWHTCPASARLALAAGAVIGTALWSLVAVLAVVIADAVLFASLRSRLAGIGALLTLALAWTIATVVPMLLTPGGRRAVAISLARASHHEYWPAWLFYLPLGPLVLFQTIRSRSLTIFTCCNPGIGNGGGWVGESKHDIMHALRHAPEALPTFLIPPGSPAARLERLQTLRSAHESIRDFPLILKPNAGERGHALKLARSPDDALAYLSSMTGPAVVQPYHPGPAEFGVLWVRHVPPREGGPTGRIYSVTRKRFPAVTGDGVHTLEQLILRDRRLRRQAEVFLARLGAGCLAVPAPGQSVPLAVSGNHAQGTAFMDGADLITPELERAIDRMASGFEGGLDLGRFDLRAASEDSLRLAMDLAIIELNGVTSESTNLYDPARSTVWAYRVLFGLWNHLYALGRWRQSTGARPVPARVLWAALHTHADGKTGSPIAD